MEQSWSAKIPPNEPEEKCADCRGIAVVGLGSIPVWLCVVCFRRRLTRLRGLIDTARRKAEV